MSFTQAGESSSSASPVPCNKLHTSVTYATGRFAPMISGHLLTVDSKTSQSQLGARCSRELHRYLGGTQQALELSRFQSVWFTPTVQESDAGAAWFRCDLVLVDAPHHLARFLGRSSGALATSAGLRTYGTCGTSSPSAPYFRRVLCRDRHAWQAVSVVHFPPGTIYLDKGAQGQADRTCRKAAKRFASGSFVYHWAFEWPQRAAWQAGIRYGWCWVPS